jgi:hypothetical protein
MTTILSPIHPHSLSLIRFDVIFRFLWRNLLRVYNNTSVNCHYLEQLQGILKVLYYGILRRVVR